ncbi:MAG TPA: hypothetical protein VFU29_12005, partial [Chitinophagaceae bacterium]|nr:hypothetical protein [Chitinophagaceae bacterium]
CMKINEVIKSRQPMCCSNLKLLYYTNPSKSGRLAKLLSHRSWPEFVTQASDKEVFIFNEHYEDQELETSVINQIFSFIIIDG